jgi:hypothetical protein
MLAHRWRANFRAGTDVPPAPASHPDGSDPREDLDNPGTRFHVGLVPTTREAAMCDRNRIRGRRWVSAVFVLAVTASCGGRSTDESQASGSSTTDTTVSPSTTDTTVPTTAFHVLVGETAPPTDISAPAGQWLRITRENGTTQLAAVYRPEDDTAHPIVVAAVGCGAGGGGVRRRRRLLSQRSGGVGGTGPCVSGAS